LECGGLRRFGFFLLQGRKQKKTKAAETAALQNRKKPKRRRPPHSKACRENLLAVGGWLRYAAGG
jgi:hypothetical protein